MSIWSNNFEKLFLQRFFITSICFMGVTLFLGYIWRPWRTRTYKGGYRILCQYVDIHLNWQATNKLILRNFFVLFLEMSPFYLFIDTNIYFFKRYGCLSTYNSLVLRRFRYEGRTQHYKPIALGIRKASISFVTFSTVRNPDAVYVLKWTLHCKKNIYINKILNCKLNK